MLAYAAKVAPSRLPGARAGTVASVAGLALIVLAFAVPDRTSAIPGWWALAPTAGAFLVIAAGRDAWLNRHVLASRSFVLLGKISYPLYLWHFPVLVLATLERPRMGDSLRWALVALSVALAYATYRWVERPLRSRPAAVRLRPVRPLLASMAVVAVAALAIRGASGVPERFAPEVRPLLTDRYDFAAAYRRRACFLEADQGPGEFARACVPDGSAPLVLLWGDSMAAHLSPGLRAMERSGGFRLAQLTAANCPPLRPAPVARPKCGAVNRFVLGEVRRLRPQTVVLSASWFGRDPRTLLPTIEALRPHARRIVVAGPPPLWPRGLQRFAVDAHERAGGGPLPARMRTPLLAHVRRVDDAVRAAATGAGAEHLTLLRSLCDASRCLIHEGGAPTSWDGSHLTTVASTRVVRDNAALVGPG